MGSISGGKIRISFVWLQSNQRLAKEAEEVKEDEEAKKKKRLKQFIAFSLFNLLGLFSLFYLLDNQNVKRNKMITYWK